MSEVKLVKNVNRERERELHTHTHICTKNDILSNKL